MNKRRLGKIGKKGLAAVLVATSLMSVSVPAMAAESQENAYEAMQTEIDVNEVDKETEDQKDTDADKETEDQKDTDADKATAAQKNTEVDKKAEDQKESSSDEKVNVESKTDTTVDIDKDTNVNQQESNTEAAMLERTEKKMSRAEAEKMFDELKSQGWKEGSEVNTLVKIENGVKTTISYTLTQERVKNETPVMSKIDFKTKEQAYNDMKEKGLEDIEVEEVKSWSCNRLLTFATAEEAAAEHRKCMSELRLKNKDEMVLKDGFCTGKYGGISPGICKIDQLGDRELNVAMYGGAIKMRCANHDYFIPKMYEVICERFDVTKDQVFFWGTVIDANQFAYGPAKVKVTVRKSEDSVYELTYYPTEDSTEGDITYVLTDAIRRCPLTEEYTKEQMQNSNQIGPNAGQANSYGFYMTEQRYGYRGKGYTYTTNEIAEVVTTKENINTEKIS